MPTCQHGGPPTQPARTPEERARAQRVSGMKGELEGVGWAAIWVLRSSFGPSLRAQGGERPSPNETAAKSGSSSVDHESCFLLFLREKCIVLSSFPLPSIISRGIGFGHFVAGSIQPDGSRRCSAAARLTVTLRLQIQCHDFSRKKNSESFFRVQIESMSSSFKEQQAGSHSSTYCFRFQGRVYCQSLRLFLSFVCIAI